MEVFTQFSSELDESAYGRHHIHNEKLYPNGEDGKTYHYGVYVKAVGFVESEN